MDCNAPSYVYDHGWLRVGIDGQLVDVETHRTLCSSNDAIAFAQEHVRGAERERLLKVLYPPTAPPSPLADISQRKDGRPRGLSAARAAHLPEDTE